MHAEDAFIRQHLPPRLYERLNQEYGSIIEFIRTIPSELPENALVLDAGAGEGQYRAYFKDFRYVGLDFGQGDAQWDYTKLDVVGNLLEMPLEDNTFDAVLCTQVLEHVPEPLKLLQECKRVLKPGGVLYLTAPLAFGEHQQPHDYFRFTSYGLRVLAEKANLEILMLEPRGGYFTYLTAMSTVTLHYANQRFNHDWYRYMYFPFRLCLVVVFLVVLPLLAPLLDEWDPERAFTLGYRAKFLKKTGNELLNIIKD